MRDYADRSARPHRTAFTVFAVSGAVLLGLGLFMSHEKRLEVEERRARLAEEEARLEELETTRDALREWKAALETDPAAVEEAIRRKLHWVRPGERVLSWREPIDEGDSGDSAGMPATAGISPVDAGNGR